MTKEPTVKSLQMLHAIVKDLHADCVRLRAERHAADEAYHAACLRESTLAERLELEKKREPLFNLYCELCERRSAARLEFHQQKNRFVSKQMRLLDVAGFTENDTWREHEDVWPELYEA